MIGFVNEGASCLENVNEILVGYFQTKDPMRWKLCLIESDNVNFLSNQ